MTRDHADNDDHANRDSAACPTASSMALGRGLRSEALFFLSSYAFSWSIWLPAAAMDGEPSALRNLAVGVAAAGPSLAGVLCTGIEEGWGAVRRLFRSLLQWRVAARWYTLSLAGPITVALMAVAVHRLLVGNDAEFRLQATTILLVPVALVVTLFIGPLQEELGWRGYALPRLLRRWSSVRASLVLGVAWACWHLPLYAIVPRLHLVLGGHWREPAGRPPAPQRHQRCQRAASARRAIRLRARRGRHRIHHRARRRRCSPSPTSTGTSARSPSEVNTDSTTHSRRAGS